MNARAGSIRYCLLPALALRYDGYSPFVVQYSIANCNEKYQLGPTYTHLLAIKQTLEVILQMMRLFTQDHQGIC